MSPLLTWALVLLVLAVVPATVRTVHGRDSRVRPTGEGVPRRRTGAELHAAELEANDREVVDHETAGWFGATDGPRPFDWSAPREAARFGRYPLSMTTSRRRAA